MPQRFLRPGLTNSDPYNSVSFPAQSLYVRILTLVDDFGRYDGRTAILRGQCFALRPDVTMEHMEEMTGELQAADLVKFYRVNGKPYLQVTKWRERARADESLFPGPDHPAAESCAPQRSAAESCGILRNPASLVPRSSFISHMVTDVTGAGGPEEVPTPATPDPEEEPEEEETPEPETASPEEEAFREFWTAYPRKSAKKKARSAFRTERCAGIMDDVIAAVERLKHSEQWQKSAGQFIPHAATFLNQRRWEDEGASPPKPETAYWQPTGEGADTPMADFLRTTFETHKTATA